MRQTRQARKFAAAVVGLMSSPNRDGRHIRQVSKKVYKVPFNVMALPSRKVQVIAIL
jgi:hypothetical protein